MDRQRDRCARRCGVFLVFVWNIVAIRWWIQKKVYKKKLEKINIQNNNNIPRICTAELQFRQLLAYLLIYSHWRLAAARWLARSWWQLSWFASAVHFVLTASSVFHELLVVLDQFLHGWNLVRQLFVLQVCRERQLRSISNNLIINTYSTRCPRVR